MNHPRQVSTGPTNYKGISSSRTRFPLKTVTSLRKRKAGRKRQPTCPIIKFVVRKNSKTNVEFHQTASRRCEMVV